MPPALTCTSQSDVITLSGIAAGKYTITGKAKNECGAGREASVTVTIGLPASEDISGNAQIQGSGHSRFFSSTTKETKPDEVAYTLRSNLSGSVTEIYSGTVTKKMSVRLNYRCVKTIDN